MVHQALLNDVVSFYTGTSDGATLPTETVDVSAAAPLDQTDSTANADAACNATESTDGTCTPATRL